MAGAQMILSSTRRLTCSSTGISVIAGLGQRRVCIGAEQHRIGAIDANEPQLAQSPEQWHPGTSAHRRAASSADCWFLAGFPRFRHRNSRRRWPRLRHKRSCARRLWPVASLSRWRRGKTSSIAWRSSSNGTRSSTSAFTSRCLATMPSAWALILPQVACADGGEVYASRSLHVDDAPSGQVAFQRARCFLFDLRPGQHRRSGQVLDEDYSFWMSPLREPIPSEPSFSGERDGAGLPAARHSGRRRNRGRIFAYVFKKCRGGNEEQISGDSAAEVEQPVVVAGWAANKHVLEHLLNPARCAAVANKVSAEFTG